MRGVRALLWEGRALAFIRPTCWKGVLCGKQGLWRARNRSSACGVAVVTVVIALKHPPSLSLPPYSCILVWAPLHLSLQCCTASTALHCRIADLTDLLGNRKRILGVVEAEADELAAKFGTPRRTALISDGGWVHAFWDVCIRWWWASVGLLGGGHPPAWESARYKGQVLGGVKVRCQPAC